jgi:uncharacterized circularly permuted ATP-grasp superfamily protein
LERTKETFEKLVIREKYKTYEDSLILLNLDSLNQRHKSLSLMYAKAGIKYSKISKSKTQNMQTRNQDI